MKHTSKLITGSYSDLLVGKRIALCVTGSVAAVTTTSLARLLMRHGADVHCVMTEASRQIIHPYLLEWATGNEVITHLTGKIEHVTLAGKHPDRVDLVIISPSTANTIGKVANGIDDTPVTTTVSSAIGAGIPTLVVPAMHQSMYDHPAVVENIEKLRGWGIRVLAPRLEEGKAKIPTTETILEYALQMATANDMEGRKFVITAGPTRAWLDGVRFLTNPSTGKMGIALADEACSRGADVDLIIGPTAERPPSLVNVVSVETPEEMLEAVMQSLSAERADALISAAAVLDYQPTKKIEGKMKSEEEGRHIDLVATPKIIEEVRERYSDLLIVGFKVEVDVEEKELEKRAQKKIQSGICNLVVANDAAKKGVAFGTDTNQVILVGESDFVQKTPKKSKRDVARIILEEVIRRIE
ncbi:MAG: bifunctional phosphopantothenoylcysteine decarboxylase/phosphopantothenate--cysteine ligase CoaBC [Candidatus Thorarchaeota archaeon]